MLAYNKQYSSTDFNFNIFAQDQDVIEAFDRYLRFPAVPKAVNPAFNVIFNIYRSKTNSPVLGKPTFEKSQVNFKEKSIVSWVKTLESGNYVIQLDAIFLRPLSCLLQYYQFYCLHCSMVCNDNISIVILGPSGCGKSTIGSLLSLDGFDILCDDRVFISSTTQGLRIIPLPTRIAVKNIEQKKKLRGRSFNPVSIKSGKYLRKVIFLFPTYDAKTSAGIYELSVAEGVKKLVFDNLIQKNRQPFERDAQLAHLDFLCALGKYAVFLKLVYNDHNLDKVSQLVKGCC